jgi:DNA-binding response OmpR family regulator
MNTPTSGSGAYRFDRQTGEIVHSDGQRFCLRGRAQDLYAYLDERRGQTFTPETLLADVFGNDGMNIENVRVNIMRLRQRCGAGVIETVPLWSPVGGGPKHCGYIVRQP